jgi:hypothetical protein
MTDAAPDPHLHLIGLMIAEPVESIPDNEDAEAMLEVACSAVTDPVAGTVRQAGDVWCGMWRFVVAACGSGDYPGSDQDVAVEVVDDVMALSVFDMAAFSDDAPSGTNGELYAERSTWPESAIAAAAMLDDEDDVAYAIDHAIMMLSCAGVILTPMTSSQLDCMREGALSDIADRLSINAEVSAAIGSAVDSTPADHRNVAVEHLVRSHGRRNPELDETRLDDIAAALSIDLDVPTGGLAVMAEVHKAADPTSWDEIRRRRIDETSVLQAAWLFLAIDAPNVVSVDLSDPVGMIVSAAAFTSACDAMLRADPMQTAHAHPSAQMIAGTWGARAPAEASVPGAARDHLRALVRRAVAWDALVHDGRELSDLSYVVEACMETICLDADRRADSGTDWLHYGIASIVGRYASEVHSRHDLAWLDVVESTGLTGHMAVSQDPASSDRIFDVMSRGRAVHSGRVRLTHAVVHCVDPLRDRHTLDRIRSVVPGCDGMQPGRGAYDRVTALDGRDMSVDDAVALADALMTACGTHGCYVVGDMEGRPFVALAGHEGEDDAYVGTAPLTRH